ncbi:hypothetical protein CDA63_00020 [Hymenobacter amundsenii]|uniref:PAS domain-containing protein n=1 Tax=Hymenobacter amundsenii TaxID=2006685 RepID=A0A246FPU4_9BACT|nr:PAS domain-containing protein [Hymenobacter amundsenii]OWP64786.1 hypothetical protein CDA63_00020 [Hymenobacter amundsenii]
MANANYPVAALPPDAGAADELLYALLDVSQTGLLLLRPIFDETDSRIVDFLYEYLNPAAQRLLGQPEHPNQRLLALYPHAGPTGIFDFYRRVFESGIRGQEHFNYQYDGIDGYFRAVARPQGPLLVVSLSDDNDTPRTAMQEALRRSQLAEQQAREEAETERNLLQAVLTQAPVAIALFQGDECVIGTVNDQMCAIWGYPAAAILGLPLLEAVPELVGQEFDSLIRDVARTRQPFVGQQVAAQLRQPSGQVESQYFNFTFQPLYDAEGQLLGVLNIAVDVTEQVLARQQVQNLNEELAAANEELQASNEEYLDTNTQLLNTQQQLRQLNEELEHRVALRTGEVQRALAETEHQREQVRARQELLSQILGRVPAVLATFSGPDHRFTFFNDRYQEAVGGRAHLGQPVAELVPEIVAQGILGMLDHVYRTGRPYEATAAPIVLHNPGGPEPTAPRYANFICQPLLDSQGQTWGVQAFAVDVTEQVLARRERESRQTELQTIFEQAPVPIAILRGSALIVELANQAICDLWGHTPAQVLGRPYFEAVPATVGQGFEELLAGVLESGETFSIDESPVQLDRAHTAGRRWATLTSCFRPCAMSSSR